MFKRKTHIAVSVILAEELWGECFLNRVVSLFCGRVMSRI